MDMMIEKEDLYNEGKELAFRAKDEMIKTGKVTVVCPKCGNKPEVSIDGKFHEKVLVRCPCNYISMMQLGF